MQDSFEKELAALRQLGPSTFVLRGATLIVEILPPEEIKTASGLIVASSSDQARGGTAAAHRVDVAKVLMSGEGYWNENIRPGTDEPIGMEPLEAQPGAIIMMPQYSAQLLSHFPGISRPTSNKLAMIKMDQILAYYPTQEAYESAKRAING